MATQVQLRRGSTSQHNIFTGALGEITVDTDKDTLVVHDGSTQGGHPLAKESALGNLASLDSVGAAQIDTNAVGASEIATDAVTNAKIAANAVGSSEIADDAVTLAKMAGGTDGELITYDANGDPATVAVGTNGHVLTSNGAGAAPTFQAAGGSDSITEGNTTVEVVDTGSDGHITFDTEGSERMRINDSGGIRIPGSSSTNKGKLHLEGSQGAQSSMVSRSDSMLSHTSDDEAYLGSYFKTTLGYDGNDTTQHAIGVFGYGLARNLGGGTGVYGTGGGGVGNGGGCGVYGVAGSSYGTGGPTTGIKGYRNRGPSNGWGFGVWGQCETSKYGTNYAGFFEILPKEGTDANNNGIGVVGRDTNRTHTAISFRSGTSTTGTQVGSITFTTSATAYNTSSDYRLKENIVDLTGAIDRVKTIPVHRFNFKVDPDKTVDGFIAHEMSPIVPEAVTGTKDEVKNEYDDDGNVSGTTPVYQSIDQSKVVPLLTAALQEAIAKIEILETKVTALEGGE